MFHASRISAIAFSKTIDHKLDIVVYHILSSNNFLEILYSFCISIKSSNSIWSSTVSGFHWKFIVEKFTMLVWIQFVRLFVIFVTCIFAIKISYK